ncbi:MAG: hypothetical protein SF123_24310 [Chloroflexota bacterium]|nr:hypothetical protein [Chloroflexota bacterium]
MPTSITRREWRTVLLIAALVIVATLLPYLAALGQQTEMRQFSGALIGTDDIFSYFGKMRLGARGIWDFYLFYTPEPHDSVPLFFLVYIIPGQIVGLFHGERDPQLASALVFTFHLMRVAFNLLLIVVLYRFIAHFLKSPRQRVTALLLALLGGGFGWLTLLLFGDSWLGSLPPELFIPEGFTFLILLTLPHLALARSLLLIGMLALFKAIAAKREGWRWSLLASICWLLVGIIVPFYLAVLYALLGAWGLAVWIRQRRFPLTLAAWGGLAAMITLPLFAYYLVAGTGNPVFAAWYAQSSLTSPHPLHYLSAYGLLLLLSAAAMRWAWLHGRRSPGYVLLPAWVAMMPVLVYALPDNVQRRMAEGVIVPLAIMGTHGLTLLARRLHRRQRVRVRNTVVAISSLSSLLVLLLAIISGLSTAPPVQIPTAELVTYAWLEANAPAESVVLSAFKTGTRLPVYTALRPYVGHGPESMNSSARTQDVERFFRNEMSADERAALMASVNVRYIFYGAEERALQLNAAASDQSIVALPPLMTPHWTDGMTLVYDAGGYQVWAVNAAD